MTAPSNIPFWVPIVAPTLSDAHLATVLPAFTAGRLSTLRARFGFPEFVRQPGAPAVNWLVLLGQIEDELLAELVTLRFGALITASLVAAIRDHLGVTSYSARRPRLEPHIRELVGRYAPANIEKGWGVSIGVIKAFHRLSPETSATAATSAGPTLSGWPQEQIDLLWHQSNAQVARLTGRSLRAVREARSIERIPAPTTRSYWREVSDDELASMSDEQLSELYGGPLADFAAQRLTMALSEDGVVHEAAGAKELPARLSHYLNKMSMKRLAKVTGISEFYLKRQRDALGLAPYDPFPPAFESLLATCPDSEVAEKTHTAVSTVKYRRDKLGLPAYTPPK